MPPAGIVILGIAISQAALIGIGLSLALTIVTGVLQSVVFAKKPKNNPLAFQNRTITIKQPVSPHQTIYGSARVGGTVVFLERLGTGATADVWIGIVWAGHECKAIDSIYADDEQIFVNEDGSVQGDRAGQIEVYNHLGDADQTYDTNLAAAFPLLWTEDHRLRGRCYTIFQLVDLGTNWDSTIPNLTADIRGKLITDSRTGEEVFTDNAGQCIRDFLMDGNSGLAEDATRIDTPNFNAESNICDEEVAIPEWSEHWVIDDGPDAFTVSSTVNDNLDIAGLSQAQALTKYPNGTAVTLVNSGGALPSPLAASTTYYISQAGASPNDGQLYTNEADALAGTNRIDITNTGTGTHTIAKVEGAIFRMLGRETTFTANAADDGIDLIDFLFGTDASACILSTTGTMPGGLTEGTRYRLEASIGHDYAVADYFSGVATDITSAGTGTHTVRLFGRTDAFTSISVSSTDDTIGLSPGEWVTGTPLRLSNSGGAPPAPLVDGLTYYAVDAGASAIRLAESRADAEAGRYIDLQDAGSGTQVLESLITSEELLGATTGVVVRVAVSTSGALPTGLSTATDYYFIRRGRGVFQLAATLQDALGGTAIVITDTGTDTNDTYKITLKRERRYTINGVFDADQDKREVLKGMASAIGIGAILEPLGTGKWRMKAGSYCVPLGTLGLGDIRGGGVPEVQTRIERRSTANTVKGVYNSPLNFDQASDFPALSNPKYIAEDGGEILVEDLTLPFTNSKEMARRIAKSWLRRKRLQRSIRFPAKLAAGFKYEYGDGVAVTLPLLGYSNKTFEVQGWEFNADSSEGAPVPKVDLILRENSPQVWG